MNSQKGFTLIELMVVIVIIGILSALAIPRMIGVSAKAKGAEVPTIAANFETLQAAYIQETGAPGTNTQVGFGIPTSDWWTYAVPGAGQLTATTNVPLDGSCGANEVVSTTAAVGADGDADFTRAVAAACAHLMPNFN